MHSPVAENVKGSYISRGMLGSVDIAGARERNVRSLAIRRQSVKL